ncbi:GNAT family N-acetyltransferase [Salinisphaera sp.]|uniref:GNAT family N-acetyltransferase n=1 Tax=Salinisphaera sp. TaxID=1914330 RepID=UPI002D78341B|nr:GNAT family N-acetyltransferase [Salinisphaera sp.]HET7313260.1 GNAT family N-acetyltransferase [Salinisphaera sp.]
MAELTQIESILQVDAEEWNALCGTDQPFVQHGFLAALEASGSVSPHIGWQPAHALLRTDDGALVGAAPMYLKDHSFGEFVFDFAWANAYSQVGLDYYPKLVNAVPFTPVAGPRLLARDDATRRAFTAALATLPERMGISSLHTLFGDDVSTAAMLGADAHARRGCQYRWFNRDYRDFEDFLNALSSKRRKEIRRERRRMREAGVEIVVRHPAEISHALWQTLYAFYGRTYAIRGQDPYLTPEFFSELTSRLGDQVLFFIAYHEHTPVGMAFMMRSRDTLYGRHWGCKTDYHSLHFETCYYAGIEYCIDNGLACFDAGAQGEHKIRRGFEPVATWSTHIIADPRLDHAIGDFVEREAEMMAAFQTEQRERCNFATTPETCS